VSSILKNDALIRTIRRRGFIPESQDTFSEDDFLEMATEEVNIGLIPLVMKMHEEHIIYYEDVELQLDVLKYAIPSRAHGNKLRDVFLIDNNGNLFDMARYSLGEISDFKNTTSYVSNRGFYLENNNVCLVNFEVGQNHKLRMYFYMRPNKLVSVSRGAIASTLNTQFEQDYISPKSGSASAISIATRAVITSVGHGLNSGEYVSITGSDSTPSIDGLYEIAVTSSDSFSINVTTTVAGTSASWIKQLQVVQANLSSIPAALSSALKFDIVQSISPNKIIHYDLVANVINQTLSTISFAASKVPNIVQGSYITAAEESVVANIPTELHPLLAQRVAVACLEAMGDEQNKQSAERKLKQMEDNAMTFLDNRVEGAQIKIKSKNSALVSTLNQYAKRNRRW
jgi:hypothetical protein